jgi:hypothetical protein
MGHMVKVHWTPKSKYSPFGLAVQIAARASYDDGRLKVIGRIGKHLFVGDIKDLRELQPGTTHLVNQDGETMAISKTVFLEALGR